MKTNYSYDDLPIEVPIKALFELSSGDVSKVPMRKRIEVLSRLILLGYDLKLIVADYLKLKDSKNETQQMNRITDAFNSYSNYMLTNEELYTASRLKSELKKAIENFKSIVKQYIAPAFSLEGLISAYIENDAKAYNEQKEFWNIDLAKI